MGPTGYVLATDNSSNILAFAAQEVRNRGLTNFETRVMDGEDLSLPEASFDAVLSRVALIYFPNQQRALTGMLRVLKPGSRTINAVYTTTEKNGFFAVPISVIRRRAQLPPPAPRQPGPFSLGSEGVLADACRRAGAAHLTAVVPYFGYARQDRRASGREAVGARLIADLLQAAGLQRLLAVDLHTAALEGVFAIPLEHLSAVPLLVQAVRPWVAANAVIVAPDLGAVKLAERYASLLQRPLAIVHKPRVSGVDVRP